MAIDRAVYVGGQAAAPLDYVVPNATEVILRAVQATFDGSAASGPFVACVELYSDGGRLVSRGLTAETISQGGTASVSFAAGLNAGGATQLSFASAVVAAAGAGTTTIVAAVGGKQIRVVQVGLMADGFGTVKFTGAGDLTGGFPLAPNTGFVLGPVTDEERYWYQTASGQALGLNVSTGINVGGVVGYVLV